MNNKIKDQVYWYTQQEPRPRELDRDLEVEAVVVGAGMGGLSAAQVLQERGVRVAVVEKTFCGAGASGKTSGFITPDSELELSSLLDDYGPVEAKKIWQFVENGVTQIKKNIEQYRIDCDYQTQDSLYIANSRSKIGEIESEYEARKTLDYSSIFYTKEQLPSVIGTNSYHAAVRYPDTFGINSYLYCQAFRNALENRGVEIYENTPVDYVGENIVGAGGHTIKANHIILAADRFLPALNKVKQDVYHVQTFLAISKPLSDEEVRMIFPSGDKMMVWDTDLVYQYFRVTGGNRLLIGGSNVFYTYLPNEWHNPPGIAAKLYHYVKTRFPSINLELEYLWPGMLGVSKDLLPIAEQDETMKSVHYFGAAAGLPWAAALGRYVVDKIFDGRNDLDRYFSSKRKFIVPYAVQRVITTPATFALSHGAKELF